MHKISSKTLSESVCLRPFRFAKSSSSGGNLQQPLNYLIPRKLILPKKQLVSIKYDVNAEQDQRWNYVGSANTGGSRQ